MQPDERGWFSLNGVRFPVFVGEIVTYSSPSVHTGKVTIICGEGKTAKRWRESAAGKGLDLPSIVDGIVEWADDERARNECKARKDADRRAMYALAREIGNEFLSVEDAYGELRLTFRAHVTPEQARQLVAVMRAAK